MYHSTVPSHEFIFNLSYYDYVNEKLSEMAGKIAKAYTSVHNEIWLNEGIEDVLKDLQEIVIKFTTACKLGETISLEDALKILKQIEWPTGLLDYHPELNNYLTPEDIAADLGATLNKENWPNV